ncbi:MAG: hypothetical protein PVG30_01960 [Gammaproteobacteria bacterium]|jgi:hypothetical protein
MNYDEAISKNMDELNNVCTELDRLMGRKKHLLIQTEEYKREKNKKGLIITDHSIVSYFKRVLGFNIEEIKERIIKQDLKGRYKVMGDGIFDQGDFRVVVKNNSTITILNKEIKK